MKNVKFVLVALAAIGITIASQGGSIAHFKKASNYYIACYTSATIPSPGTSINQGSSGCATAGAQVGFTATAFSGVVSNPAVSCPGGNRFCCANIESTTGYISSVTCYTGF
ncbi:MAG: hypothetical protein P4L51_24655 [Puia sp.]|nr:hypothetical protein [Puia sp.]